MRNLPSQGHSLHRLHMVHHLLHHQLHHVETILHMVSHQAPRHHAGRYPPVHCAHGPHLIHHGAHVLAQQIHSDLGTRRLADTPQLLVHEPHPSNPSH